MTIDIENVTAEMLAENEHTFFVANDEEERQALMEMLEALGIRWGSGDPPTKLKYGTGYFEVTTDYFSSGDHNDLRLFKYGGTIYDRPPTGKIYHILQGIDEVDALTADIDEIL